MKPEPGMSKSKLQYCLEWHPKEFYDQFSLFAYQGDKAMVERMLEAGASVNYAHHRDGSTALHGAAMAGQDKVVTLLLRHGAKDRPDAEGQTALDIASEHLARTRSGKRAVDVLKAAERVAPSEPGERQR